MKPMVRSARPASRNRRNRLMNRQGTIWNRPEPKPEPKRSNQIPHGTGTGPTRIVAITNSWLLNEPVVEPPTYELPIDNPSSSIYEITEPVLVDIGINELSTQTQHNNKNKEPCRSIIIITKIKFHKNFYNCNSANFINFIGYEKV